jgi:hypothetical protein
MENTLSKLNSFDLINIDKSNLTIDVTLPINITSKDIYLKRNSKAKKYLNNSF